VNTHEPYERLTQPPAAPSQLPTRGEPEVAALAVHQDPSLAAEPPKEAEAAEQSRASIVWVRPADLITTVGASRLRQSADAQADLVRRYRRAPLTAVSRLRGRVTRSSIARTDPAVRTSTPPEEGLQL